MSIITFKKLTKRALDTALALDGAATIRYRGVDFQVTKNRTWLGETVLLGYEVNGHLTDTLCDLKAWIRLCHALVDAGLVADNEQEG
jgi:hypothetical protein